MKIKRKTSRAEVPSMAMGDIAFNLLIFFVILARAQDDSHLQWTPAEAANIEAAGHSKVSIVVDKENDLYLNGSEIGVGQLADAIQEQLGDRPYFVEYRHKGLMGALELKYPKSQLPLSAVDQLALRRALLDQGLYLFGRNNHLILMPSFVLTQEDVDVAVGTIRNVLDNSIPRL